MEFSTVLHRNLKQIETGHFVHYFLVFFEVRVSTNTVYFLQKFVNVLLERYVQTKTAQAPKLLVR